MSSLTTFREHCRAMSTAEHRPECAWLLWKPGGAWVPQYEGEDEHPASLRWIAPPPRPECNGCLTEADRALFAQMAAEVDDYLAPQPDLFGEMTPEPTTPMREVPMPDTAEVAVEIGEK